jgi:hypothetical protein
MRTRFLELISLTASQFAVYARLGTEDGRWFIRWRIGRLMISANELGAMNFDA